MKTTLTYQRPFPSPFQQPCQLSLLAFHFLEVGNHFLNNNDIIRGSSIGEKTGLTLPNDLCQMGSKSPSNDLCNNLILGVAKAYMSEVLRFDALAHLGIWKKQVELTLGSIWTKLKVSIQNFIVVRPRISQYLWNIKRWIPSGPGALLGLKENKVLLIFSGEGEQSSIWGSSKLRKPLEERLDWQQRQDRELLVVKRDE